jgi:hypothetical protein
MSDPLDESAKYMVEPEGDACRQQQVSGAFGERHELTPQQKKEIKEMQIEHE